MGNTWHRPVCPFFNLHRNSINMPDTITATAWKVFAYKGDRLIAEYLFAVPEDAEAFKADMDNNGYETKLLLTEVGG